MYKFNQVLTGFQNIEFINEKDDIIILPLEEIATQYKKLFHKNLHCIKQLYNIGYTENKYIKLKSNAMCN